MPSISPNRQALRGVRHAVHGRRGWNKMEQIGTPKKGPLAPLKGGRCNKKQQNAARKKDVARPSLALTHPAGHTAEKGCVRMRRKHYRRILAGSLAVVILIFLGVWMFVPRGPTRDDVARIQPGMSPAEVERVLGQPPNDADELGPKPHRSPHDEFWHPAMTEKTVRCEIWKTRAAVIYVWYIDGVVESADFFERAQVSFWKRLAARARLDP